MRAERRKAAEVRWHLVTVHLNPGPHGRTQEEKRRRREREVPEEEREERGEGQAKGGGSGGGRSEQATLLGGSAVTLFASQNVPPKNDHKMTFFKD